MKPSTHLCMPRTATVIAGAILAALLAAPLQARITKIEIKSAAPARGGDGYEQITGTAYGEVDPAHPLNAIIQDIELAPRNERGMVEYLMDFTILKPPNGGNGLLFYEVVNRGFPLSQFGPYFPMVGKMIRKRGYTVVWSGWQGDLLPLTVFPFQHRMKVPIATRNGSEITSRIRREYEVKKPASTLSLVVEPGRPPISPYEPVDLTAADAVLTRRLLDAGPRLEVPREDWAFANCKDTPFPGEPSSLHICSKDGFEPGYIYELTYTGKNPLVLGLGLAATRDLVSFLRHDAADDFGTPNPVADATHAAVMQGNSQSGRFMRTFLHLGFNRDANGRMVFEGMNLNVGPLRLALNIRFGNPMGTTHQHISHLQPLSDSPFTWMPAHDSLARRTGWILKRCLSTNTCPKIIATVSANEYWEQRASLHTTDPLGRHDAWIPRNVRMYLFSSTQHVPQDPPKLGICQQLSNPNEYRHNLVALLVALEHWVIEGKEPPPNRIPTLRDGTLTPSDKASSGWPDIPGVRYTGLVNALTLVDYGPEFEPADQSGILREPPIVQEGKDYAVLVPKVDADGNDIAGIRSATAQAPLGTYTGWNLRRAGFAQDETCGHQGSFIPFAETKAEREAAGDPRLSLEERYGDHDGYVAAVTAAANRLVAERFLLPEDAAAIIAEAEASDVLVPEGNEPPVAVAEPVGLQTVASELQLDGSKSSDPEGEALTYAWKVVGKSASISDATSATPTVQLIEGSGLYSFELTVTDPHGAISTAMATVDFIGR